MLRVVSLYSGAGGLDYGFEAAGFETAVAVELDADCCATLRRNRNWAVIEGDIHQTSSDAILQAGNLKPGEVDVLIGGPPCQPFSKAGYWSSGDTKRLEDPRAGTLAEYMRCVADLQPKVFLLENVHGISYSGKEEGFQLLLRLTEEINQKHGTNYRLSWKVLTATDYGVPQVRTRFIMVGHRDGELFNFPEPTHFDTADETLFTKGKKPYITAWDALFGLEKHAEGEDLRVRGRWGDLLPSIPEGENYLWHTDRKGGLPLFGWRTRYWSFLLKLAKNRPSWTIQAQPGPAIGPFHWDNRMLSTRELARIQTFPSDIQFVGSRQSVQKQIGNAVPSLLAEVLAREIAQQFFGKSVPKTPKLAIKPRKTTPPPNPVLPVPQQYLHLAGEHAPHPGTGKGRAYQQELTPVG